MEAQNVKNLSDPWLRRHQNQRLKEPSVVFFHVVPHGLGKAKIISKLILLWELLRIYVEMSFINKQSSLLNYHRCNVDLESACCPPPKGDFLLHLLHLKAKKPAHSDNNDAPAVKLPTEIVEISSDPRHRKKIKLKFQPMRMKALKGTVTMKEATASR
ncbi:hypothetical protein Bca52824_054279 [Brassica carinata]|uniref:Uncharacterized protein n=1 Tax=Brassica carinata TaxID=52824 RepID=A0A8X7RD80_BRACI|nr:hypothetical protein Bca52824_054279 [Brassica carinata]